MRKRKEIEECQEVSKDCHINLGRFQCQNIIKSPHGVYGFTALRTFKDIRWRNENLVNFLMNDNLSGRQ